MYDFRNYIKCYITDVFWFKGKWYFRFRDSTLQSFELLSFNTEKEARAEYASKIKQLHNYYARYQQLQRMR